MAKYYCPCPSGLMMNPQHELHNMNQRERLYDTNYMCSCKLETEDLAKGGGKLGHVRTTCLQMALQHRSCSEFLFTRALEIPSSLMRVRVIE